MRLFALPAIVLACAPLCAQEPPRPTVDQIAGKLTDLRKQRAELDKQEAALLGDLRAELKRIADVVERLGLDSPAPKPPAPVPPPKPVDPLKAKLKAAFDADPEPTAARKEHALDLAALYREAAKLSADPAVATAGALLERVRDAARALVGADALVGVRKAAGAELGALLPTDAPLTADQRASAAALFAKLAAALEELGK